MFSIRKTFNIFNIKSIISIRKLFNSCGKIDSRKTFECISTTKMLSLSRKIAQFIPKTSTLQKTPNTCKCFSNEKHDFNFEKFYSMEINSTATITSPVSGYILDTKRYANVFECKIQVEPGTNIYFPMRTNSSEIYVKGQRVYPPNHFIYKSHDYDWNGLTIEFYGKINSKCFGYSEDISFCYTQRYQTTNTKNIIGSTDEITFINNQVLLSFKTNIYGEPIVRKGNVLIAKHTILAEIESEKIKNT